MNIERAIETVRQFNEKKSDPQDLQRSVDILSAYTTALPRMQTDLAARVLETARTYNERVREQDMAPATISGILRQLFGKKPVRRHEIYIPSHSDKIFSVLQSVQRNSDADSSPPKQSELDLFRTKALSLLVDENVPLVEALELVKSAKFSYALAEGAYLLQDNVMHLCMHTSRLPGCEFEIRGSFQRDTFRPELAIPIKTSFACTSHIAMTAFPHPSQYIGFSLHDLLIPSCLLRPKMCPKFESFLEEKRATSQKLRPEGSLFKQAQAHLKNKKALYNSSHELFLLVHQLPLPYKVDFSPHWFDELSNKAAQYAEEHIARPIHRLQDEWLLNPDLASSTAESRLEACRTDIEKFEEFSKAAISLYLMQLSEHFSFEPHILCPFERTLFTSLFRQQLIFIHELSQPTNPVEIIQQEIALFQGKPANDPFTLRAQELVEELLQYYSVRFETL